MSMIKKIVDDAVDAILTRKEIDQKIMSCNQNIEELEKEKASLIESYKRYGLIYENCLDGLTGRDGLRREDVEDYILELINELEEDEKE